METDPVKITHLQELAHQYVKMIESIKELKYLRSLDTGEKLDPRDKIKATANRVGLAVPKVPLDSVEFSILANSPSAKPLSLSLVSL